MLYMHAMLALRHLFCSQQFVLWLCKSTRMVVSMTADCNLSCVDSRNPLMLTESKFEVDLQPFMLARSLCVLSALGGPVAISQ